MDGPVPFGIDGEGLEEENELTGEVVDAALQVHKSFGPGLLERLYVGCLASELSHRGIAVERELPLDVRYRGRPQGIGYRADLVVEDKILVEAKACQQLRPIHRAQLHTYMELTGIRVGLLINFNVRRLREGIVRHVVT